MQYTNTEFRLAHGMQACMHGLEIKPKPELYEIIIIASYIQLTWLSYLQQPVLLIIPKLIANNALVDARMGDLRSRDDQSVIDDNNITGTISYNTNSIEIKYNPRMWESLKFTCIRQIVFTN